MVNHETTEKGTYPIEMNKSGLNKDKNQKEPNNTRFQFCSQISLAHGIVVQTIYFRLAIFLV